MRQPQPPGGPGDQGHLPPQVAVAPSPVHLASQPGQPQPGQHGRGPVSYRRWAQADLRTVPEYHRSPLGALGALGAQRPAEVRSHAPRPSRCPLPPGWCCCSARRGTATCWWGHAGPAGRPDRVVPGSSGSSEVASRSGASGDPPDRVSDPSRSVIDVLLPVRVRLTRLPTRQVPCHGRAAGRARIFAHVIVGTKRTASGHARPPRGDARAKKGRATIRPSTSNGRVVADRVPRREAGGCTRPPDVSSRISAVRRVAALSVESGHSAPERVRAARTRACGSTAGGTRRSRAVRLGAVARLLEHGHEASRRTASGSITTVRPEPVRASVPRSGVLGLGARLVLAARFALYAPSACRPGRPRASV